MELVATWWPAALAALVCLVLVLVVATLTSSVLDDEVGDSAPANVLLVVMFGAPIAAAVLVGPSPDPSTALVGVLAVGAGLGVHFILTIYLADHYLGPAWNGARTRPRVRVASTLSLGAAIATVVVLGWWLPTALGMTTALVVVAALGLVALLPLLYVAALWLRFLIGVLRGR